MSNITLSDATEIARKHFKVVCSNILTFNIVTSLDIPELPYIAIRCREHCFLEPEFRVHDVTVNRDGSIRSTVFVGVDGKGPLPAVTAQ